MYRSISRFLVPVLVLSLLFSLAGCKGEISSEDTTATSATASTLVDSYLLLDTEIKEFNTLYNVYMKANAEKREVKSGKGKTYNGEDCDFIYAKTESYKTLTLTKKYSDKMVVDEYFRLNDGSLFLARSTAYNDGTFGLVEKYVVRDNKLLFLDSSDKTVKTLAEINSDNQTKIMAEHDMFLHFEDIEYVYEQ